MLAAQVTVNEGSRPWLRSESVKLPSRLIFSMTLSSRTKVPLPGP